jgi:hypothetical protein
MLFWEVEDPRRGVVHHLAVLCYYLQHPHLYSPEAVRWGVAQLAGFVEGSLTPAEVRAREGERLGSGARGWKVTARPGAEGKYDVAVAWTMTAADVVAGGPDAYVESVRTWAHAMLHDLRAAGAA